MELALKFVSAWEKGMELPEGDYVRLRQFRIYRENGSFSLDVGLRKVSNDVLEFHAEEGIIGA